jgi:hypothetical protein
LKIIPFFLVFLEVIVTELQLMVLVILIMAVCIPPKEYYIGNKKFSQADKWIDQNGNKIDKTIFH